LKVKALKGAIIDASDILAFIFSGIIRRIFVADEDFFNCVQGVLVMLLFNSML
jgi:hypothetical protein